MGLDTEERLRIITKEAAREAAQEAARLVYEQFYPVLVKREHPVIDPWKFIRNVCAYIIGEIDKRLGK